MAAALRCYCDMPSAVAVAAASRRKKSSPSSRTVVVRASSSMDACSGDASKVGSNSVRVTSKQQQVVSKVYYEDRINGILCYTDCNGELVCEGMDEGPRLTWQDMERLNKEKKAVKEAEEDLMRRQRTLPPVAGWMDMEMDWSKLQDAVGMGKN